MSNTVIHFEIPADDVERLKAFYEGLFNWKFIYSEMPGMPYWIIQTVPTDEEGMLLEQGVNGGLYQKQNELQKPTNWIHVENIENKISKLIELGGKIVVPRMEIPGVGWTVVGVDPEGNQIALLQPKM
jgi:predicted enzyme related to lactoylglutathione lyase